MLGPQWRLRTGQLSLVLSLSIPHRTRPVSSCETRSADMWCCRQPASRKRPATHRLCALRSHLKQAAQTISVHLMRISAVAGSPRSPLSHTAVSASRTPARQANQRSSPSLGCAAWTGARDVLNARSNFDEPLSDGGEVRIVEGICVWNGAGQRMQSSRRARFGRRHKCAIGPVHPYYTDELRYIHWHGNSPCAQPWSVS